MNISSQLFRDYFLRRVPLSLDVLLISGLNVENVKLDIPKQNQNQAWFLDTHQEEIDSLAFLYKDNSLENYAFNLKSGEFVLSRSESFPLVFGENATLFDPRSQYDQIDGYEIALVNYDVLKVIQSLGDLK